MFGIERLEDGGLRLHLPHAEAWILRTLPARLRAILEDPDTSQRVIDRLFPRAYRDEAEEAEYRALLGSDLRARRKSAIDAMEQTLERLRRRRRYFELSLSAQEVDLWLGVINDLRLVFGTALGIEHNEWTSEIDGNEHADEELALLHFLTWMQQALLDGLGFVGQPLEQFSEPAGDPGYDEEPDCDLTIDFDIDLDWGDSDSEDDDRASGDSPSGDRG